jgi:hypothetical protein
MGNFGELEKILDLHRSETVLRIDCCRDMCVAFWDPTHPTLRKDMSLMNSHRTSCPKCGQARYVHGTKTPVRVFWYLPIKFWLQDLFAKGDLVPHMANDLDPATFPDGHIRRYYSLSLPLRLSIDIATFFVCRKCANGARFGKVVESTSTTY